jgi:Protein of unknown function (DUF3592)
MEIKQIINFAVCAMFVIAGTLFAVIAYREWRNVGRIIKMGEETQGVVIEMYRRPRKVGETGTPNSFAPVVLFTTNKGEQRKYYSTMYSTNNTYQVGQKVDIWYLPDEPEKASLKGADAWILPVVFGIFGGVMCLIGYPWLFGILRQKLHF